MRKVAFQNKNVSENYVILYLKNDGNSDADFLKPCYGLSTKGEGKIDVVSFNFMSTVWGSFKLHNFTRNSMYISYQ
jgi:hypothetical protein